MKKLPPDVRERIDAELVTLKMLGAPDNVVKLWQDFANSFLVNSPDRISSYLGGIRYEQKKYSKKQQR